MPPSKSAHFGLLKHLQNSLPLSAHHPLSPREAEVLVWFSDGKRDREIATILGISLRTVQKHVQTK